MPTAIGVAISPDVVIITPGIVATPTNNADDVSITTDNATITADAT